jgi:hypothetical protein
MGTWGDGLFEDDLALDVKGHFDRAVAGGATEADAAAGLMQSALAREILEEFAEGDRDDLFWEENRGLFYAIANLQLQHGVLQEEVKRQTLQAIAVERRGLDPERNRERRELLDALEARLRAGDADDDFVFTERQLAEGTNPAIQLPPADLGVRATRAKKPARKKPAKKKPAKKKPAKKKPAAKKPPKKKPAKNKPTKRR